MAWCRQVTSHYLNQCWPGPMTPYGITRPQWVNRSPSFPPVNCHSWQSWNIIFHKLCFITILTRWGRDKMAAIFQTTFSNAFSWMKMCKFRLRFISLKYVPKGPINKKKNIPTLVQIMAWRRPGDKPLSEPMMVILLTHICVTRPQWVKIHTSKQDFRVHHFKNTESINQNDSLFLNTYINLYFLINHYYWVFRQMNFRNSHN